MEINRLKELLEASLEKYRGKEIGLAFSGGLDSSVLAKMLKNLGIKFTGYVAGMENSRDIKQARRTAEEIGFQLEVIKLERKDIEKAILIERDILKKLYEKDKREELDVNPIPISYNLPLYFAAEKAKEKIILIGNGSDEMLGGYNKYEKMEKQDAELEMKKDTDKFLKYGKKQNEATANFFHKEFVFPFLDEKIVDFCLQLDYKHKIKKIILRQLGENIGLSRETANVEKKAGQYGSGIIWEMKKLAKQSGHHISIYTRSL